MTGEAETVKFSAPWGLATRIITALVILLITSVTVIALTTAKLPPVAAIALATTPPLIIACTAPFMILGYKIEDQTLIVRRLGWTTRISLAGLRAAELTPKVMNSSIRLVGNGGLFAFNGIFWSKTLGRHRAYVTDLNRTVVLNLADNTVIVSPGAPDRFLALLRAQKLLPAA